MVGGAAEYFELEGHMSIRDAHKAARDPAVWVVRSTAERGIYTYTWI